jgi:hypothetical protein
MNFTFAPFDHYIIDNIPWDTRQLIMLAIGLGGLLFVGLLVRWTPADAEARTPPATDDEEEAEIS